MVVSGVFDVETFIENPANAFSSIHTYNVVFWFNSPTDEQRVCGNASAPAAGPFNGEQNAGLLAMITHGEQLHHRLSKRGGNVDPQTLEEILEQAEAVRRHIPSERDDFMAAKEAGMRHTEL